MTRRKTLEEKQAAALVADQIAQEKTAKILQEKAEALARQIQDSAKAENSDSVSTEISDSVKVENSDLVSAENSDSVSAENSDSVSNSAGISDSVKVENSDFGISDSEKADLDAIAFALNQDYKPATSHPLGCDLFGEFSATSNGCKSCMEDYADCAAACKALFEFRKTEISKSKKAEKKVASKISDSGKTEKPVRVPKEAGAPPRITGSKPKMLISAFLSGVIFNKASYDLFIATTPEFAGYTLPWSRNRAWALSQHPELQI